VLVVSRSLRNVAVRLLPTNISFEGTTMRILNKTLPVFLALGLVAAGSANANIISDLNQATEKYGTAQSDLVTLKDFLFDGDFVNNNLTETLTLTFDGDQDESNCLCYRFLSWR